jgi:hypothetical protein
MTQGLNVSFGFQFQSSGDHPARSFSGQLIQRFCDFGGLSFNVICGKLEHGVSFLRLLPLGFVTLRIRRLSHIGNPQLSTMAPFHVLEASLARAGGRWSGALGSRRPDTDAIGDR